MSIEIMAEAWRLAPCRGGELLFLLALADQAGDVDRCAWPGMRMLMDRTRSSRRSVYNYAETLQELNVIEQVLPGVAEREIERFRRARHHGHETTVWRIRPSEEWIRGADSAPHISREEGDESTDVDVLRGATSARLGVQRAALEPQARKPSTTRRKKTSSSPSRTRGRSSSDPEPDQSTLDAINDELRPGMEPQPVEETPRVRRQRKHQEEHIHAPLRRNAEGLACYWGVELEKVGSLEASEEAIVRKYFKAWLDKGLSVKMGRQMVDAFFADLELVDSTQRWKRFVANAELLRQRVVSGMDEVSTTDVKPFAWIDALPPALRKAALSGEDVA